MPERTNNRWTDKQARKIRELRAQGMSVDDLRKLYGGSGSTMWALLYGVSYKGAGGPIAGKDYPARSYHFSFIV